MENNAEKFDISKITISGKVLNALAVPSFSIAILYSVIQMLLGNYGSLNFILVGICGGGMLWAVLSILYMSVKILEARAKLKSNS